jgi:hypothetical protein
VSACEYLLIWSDKTMLRKIIDCISVHNDHDLKKSDDKRSSELDT